MKYFNKNNEALTPYREYEKYTLYSIDFSNRTAGIEFYFDFTEDSDYTDIIKEALRTAFAELGMNKIYVNVIRDDYFMYKLLDIIGFVTECIHRESYYDEHPHDVIYMSLLRDEQCNI